MASNIQPQSQPKQTLHSTALPIRKVTFGTIAGALVTLAVYVLNNHLPPLEGDKKITPEVSSAATIILTSIVSYLVPPGKDEAIAEEKGQLKSAKH